MVDHERLLKALLRFASTLVRNYDIDDVLGVLSADVASILDVTGAGVMLEDEGGVLRFAAASDDRIGTIESLQVELKEGPCLLAYRSGERVVVPDLAAIGWLPRFGPRAAAAGIHAVYSFPLQFQDRRIGALNLYHGEPRDESMDEETLSAAQLLADMATTYILSARSVRRANRVAEQLQHALDSRVLIEQAKGALVERHRIDDQEAFERLRGYARSRGRKLREVAQEVLDQQLDLPDAGRRQREVPAGA